MQERTIIRGCMLAIPCFLKTRQCIRCNITLRKYKGSNITMHTNKDERKVRPAVSEDQNQVRACIAFRTFSTAASASVAHSPMKHRQILRSAS